MKPVIVDLHNHTTLCNHAEGSMEEYVEEALKKGVGVFGFSDHAPMDFDTRYRMGFDEMADYEARTLALKKQYADHLEILLGYEVDWLPGHMDCRVLEADVDYLIGSVHFIEEWGFDNPEFIGRYQEADIDTLWRTYFSLVADMAASGHFQIVGHLDLLKLFRHLPRVDILTLAQEALEAIKEAGMAIEINSAGFRKPIKEAYPSFTLLKQARAMEIPITFGSDAHAPQQVGFKQEACLALAREAGYDRAVIYRKKEPLFVPLPDGTES